MDFASKISKTLDEFRENRTLTDVTICVEDRRFPAHELMLRASSDYFKGLFSSGMKEISQDDIKIEGITAHAFEVCLDFMYCKNVDAQISGVDEMDLLLAANMLLLTDLVKKLVGIIANKLKVENCLEAWKMSDYSTCEAWEDQVLDFICRNVMQFLTNEEILKSVPKKLLKKIFKSNDLCISNESVLFEALVDWISLNADAKDNDFCSLFQLIRLPIMDRSFFRKAVRKHKHLDECDYCQNYWKQTVLFLFGEENHGLKEIQMVKRKADEFNESDILLVEEDDNKVVKFCDGVLRDTKFVFPKFPYDTNSAALQLYKGSLYLMGGDNDRRIFKCKPGDSEWQFITRLPNCHNDNGYNSKVMIYQTTICVIGGKVDGQFVPLADCYFPKRKRWEKITIQYSDVLLVYDEMLFQIGGWRTPSTQIFKYRANTSRWSKHAQELNEGRCCHSAVVYDKKIVVAGGRGNLRRYINSVETYKSGDSRWSTIKPLKVPRTNCCMMVSPDSGKLFVLGGDRPGPVSSTFESLSLDTDEWEACDEQSIPIIWKQINQLPASTAAPLYYR